jgi:hypothetical protein
VAPSFDDPTALVPADLSAEDARRYEVCVLEELRNHFIGRPTTGLVVVDEIEIVGSRPDMLFVFRYHHRPEFIGRAPEVVEGPLVEVAELWDLLLDESHPNTIEGPAIAAVYLGSAFDAAELMIADPETLRPLRRAPAIFPAAFRCRRVTSFGSFS